MSSLTPRVTASLVGAAIGDALGWPQENRSSNTDRHKPTPSMTFRNWRRRGGGRFNPYEEEIVGGDYSDDTQMLCVVARSLMHGEKWFEWLTRVEIPLFPVYQRGGGRALLAACKAWTAGVAPWREDKSTSPESYFQAGGNGGAMRVLPHAVTAAESREPVDLTRVFADAVSTHGHPRAIIGAAVQAVALRHALLLQGTLGYGELIGVLLAERTLWAAIPDVESVPDGWYEGWRAYAESDFESSWNRTVDEMVGLLQCAQKAMDAGALANEEQTLRELGCTGTKTVGSGTVSAAGAVYLASRAAANPRAGLMAAAFLPKADTDTLASMTASILGAFAGWEWLSPLDGQVQDHGYLRKLASALGDKQSLARTAVQPVTKSDIDRLLRQLDKAPSGQRLDFPDGRKVHVDRRDHLVSKTSADVERYALSSSDGQTLQIVRIHRPRESAPSPQETLPLDTKSTDDGPRSPESRDIAAVVRVGVRVEVADLEQMRRFYRDVIGMVATRSGTNFVTFNDVLALSTAPRAAEAATSRLTIHLDVSGIDLIWSQIEEHRVRVVDRLAVDSGRRRFRCLDPENNLLEVREAT